MPKRIAIVEDETELAALIDYNLRRHGYQPHLFNGSKGAGEGARTTEARSDPARCHAARRRRLRALPQDPPITVLGRIPVLFLTARSDEVDRVLGLEIGGDDYMTKPFSPRELIARIKAHLRREEMDAEPGALNLGPFQLDRGARRVFLSGRELKLTSTEFNLLEFFSPMPAARTAASNCWRPCGESSVL